jgi:hypothetical protein
VLAGREWAVSDVDPRLVLKKYALTDNFEEAVKELAGFVDLNQLATMLAWLEESLEGYRLEGFTLIKDPELGEPLTVAIHIKGCGFEEWEGVERRVKQRLLDMGLKELAGKTTIVCIDVFSPPPSS